jgi:hypothetical protein
MKKLILLLPLLAACGGQRVVSRVDEPSEAPGTDQARVIVFRESFRNATKPYAFLNDEEVLGFSEVGTWFEVRVTPGEHFFVLHGVGAAGVRAKLDAGKTYFLRVDSVPKLLRLELRLTPIVPGMDEFEKIHRVLIDLDRTEPIDSALADYAEEHAEELEAAISRLRTDDYEQCPVLGPDAGR